MIKILLILSAWAAAARADRGPSRYSDAFFFKVQAQFLVNMTEELLKDCRVKLRHLDMIQDTYKESLQFNLGSLSSNIMERFAAIVKTYRYYAEHLSWGDNDGATIPILIFGYGKMQSEYNEIIVEKQLFTEIVMQQERLKLALERLKKKQVISGGKLNIDPNDWGHLSPEEYDQLMELKEELGR
ncbi:uncharacterized protein LOC142974106 [Anticarsia gemmatalis]|uniref:uncharacterized protein LOC142974106 n=1 Tax=Anticarsia gemmatalis TaxID=129554 RepID=UPI003F75FFD5